jgi:hypothetical protein
MIQFRTQQSTCLLFSVVERRRGDWSSNSHLRLPASAFKAAIHHQFLWPPEVHRTRQREVRNDWHTRHCNKIRSWPFLELFFFSSYDPRPTIFNHPSRLFSLKSNQPVLRCLHLGHLLFVAFFNWRMNIVLATLRYWFFLAYLIRLTIVNSIKQTTRIVGITFGTEF